jgi:alkylation response protein AidB-like acyl-CoA dehydrogenase
MAMRRSDFSLADEQVALQETFASFLQKNCPVELVRAAEPLGFDEKLWAQFTDMRAVAMGVAEQAGGDGAGLVELALVGDLLGLHLAPVPFVDTVVAARLLAEDPHGPGAPFLTHALDGTKLISFAVGAPSRMDGRYLVPSGAIADAVIGIDGDDLVLVSSDTKAPHVINQGSAPLAWWRLDASQAHRTVLASGAAARTRFEKARREWMLLTASTFSGMTEGCQRLGVVQARERFAFGVPIGFFQGVSHRMANIHIGLVGLRRLVQKASWFADNEPDGAARLTSMAFVYGTRVANAAATDTVHVLGGVGFTLESDAQLYFRRIKGTALLAGDPQVELLRLADTVYGPIGIN